MSDAFRLFPLSALALALAACGGGGGGGGAPSDPSDPGGGGGGGGETVTFASVDCDVAASGPVSGPLDDAQIALIEQLGGNLAAVPELGASAEELVLGVSRFLDVVDGLAGAGSVLFATQDPVAGGEALFGTTQAIQCGSKSLADAFSASPLAEQLPEEIDALVRQLAELTLVIDSPDDLGTAGLEDLANRLADIADTIALLPAQAPVDAFPAELPAAAFAALPSTVLNNLADVLRASGGLDGQATADGISVTLTDVLGGVAALDPSGQLGGAVSDPLMQAQEQLANGLALVLVPLFDAIAEGGAGFGDNIIADFLVGGFGGFETFPNPLETFLGGEFPGFDGLDELLAGVPVLGDVLGTLLAAGGGDFDFTNPEAGADLLLGLLTGAGGDGGDGGAPDLLGALQDAAAQLQALAPEGFDPGDLAGGGLPTDAAALTDLLGLLADNPLGELLQGLAGDLGAGGTPDFAPEDLAGAITGLLGGFADVGGGAGGLAGLLDGVLGLLGDNPLADLVNGLLGGSGAPELGPEALTAALEGLLGGFGDFLPAG